MFYSTGPGAILKNVLQLAMTGDSASGANDLLGLRRSLAKMLELHHGPGLRSNAPEIHMVTDECQISAIAETFQVSARRLQNEASVFAKILGALEALSVREPLLGEIARLVIDSFFCTSEAQPGSLTTNGAIGVIWLCPDHSWSDLDYQEAIVHELTHTLLFLDDLCQGHYREPALLKEPRFFVRSAIRKMSRPFDLAFHSIVVAGEILGFRAATGLPAEGYRLHPATGDLLESAGSAADDLTSSEAFARICSDRSRFLLNQAIKIRSML